MTALVVWISVIVVLVGFYILTYRKSGKESVQASCDISKEDQLKYQALLSSIGEGIVVTDRYGLIELINHKAEEMVGWKNEEVVGRRWCDVALLVDEKGDQIPREKRATQKVLSTGQAVFNDTYFYVRRDGTKFPVGTTAAPIVENGKTIGVIAVFRDITHEKEVDRAKSEFVSLASHQLRTPLSAVKWFSELLIDGDAGQLTTNQSEFVGNIHKSNERLIEMVNSLLNITRIESGRIIVDPKPTNLADLVNQVLEDLQEKIREKKLTMVVSVHGQLPQVALDARMINHVYLILLSNSIKYSPEGSQITVIISKNDKEVVSQVSDAGCGIPQSDQSRIFEKFFRATNAVRTVTEGTGLGLYLAKVIVESSGGKIWFTSKENGGTTFWFTLPLTGMAPKAGEVTLNS
ncbi:MAG: PAS/PAC sensor hybrid histidine kinase [Candidatus Nomurabacteria bacterium GW2011_GWA1_46_11]|uniref:histidine kinase n=1 Tax=Candidatus Nomurabacteria bacterium GW2011_GWA1_46_11 TaxID=1618732 RepID=A0A0G1NKH0_9BACT|nr:MAG: PAS/PAC sensor hybrid histidine kinase [Microgenomates group bacterium GW2011_GWA2_44_7]KKT76928.1 MAG: PAS/PAC sensor hybrid histidine kinase [Microgenomates group bacterium GW2011_GWB1_44_8]KKU20847.1 MAG: PAS/PAC sensor hybrid histidine kinase [Candidatus Nomurabacteria bacterium GW2011_GWA1_46_11]